MDCTSLKIDDTNILLYRCIYAPIKSNMYIIINKKEAVVIDPNNNSEGFELLRKNSIDRIHLLLTHEHYDHAMGINIFRGAFKHVDLFCQKEAAKSIENPRRNNPMMVAFVLAVQDMKDGGHRYDDFKAQYKPFESYADACFDEECVKDIAGLKFHFRHTPGHCPGSCCIELGDYVFTGDSLLKSDPVILRFPESNKDDYKRITLPYLHSLPEGTIVFPGHGDSFIIENCKYLNI